MRLIINAIPPIYQEEIQTRVAGRDPEVHTRMATRCMRSSGSWEARLLVTRGRCPSKRKKNV